MRPGQDKSKNECLIVDIIVSPTVTTEANEDSTGKYRDFVCNLGIQCIENKYKDMGELDRKYKLPKLKYMGGKIEAQYIQDRSKMPKIEEVSSRY